MSLWFLFQCAAEPNILFNLLMHMDWMGNMFYRALHFSQREKEKELKLWCGSGNHEADGEERGRRGIQRGIKSRYSKNVPI